MAEDGKNVVLQKIHTYRDDFERAKKAAGITVPEVLEDKTSPAENVADVIPSKKPKILPEIDGNIQRKVTAKPRTIKLEEAVVPYPTFKETKKSTEPTQIPKPVPEEIPDSTSEHTLQPKEVHTILEPEPDLHKIIEDAPAPTSNLATTKESPEKISPKETSANPKNRGGELEEMGIAVSKQYSAKASSILSRTDEVFDVYDIDPTGAEGSIVTDHKDEGFSFFGTVIKEVRNWLFEKKDTVEELLKPKHTVSPANQRKEVIEQAAEQSALAPRDDHKLVTERLKHVPRTKSTSSQIAIKDPSEAPPSSWTHTVETDTIKPGETTTITLLADKKKRTDEETAPEPTTVNAEAALQEIEAAVASQPTVVNEPAPKETVKLTVATEPASQSTDSRADKPVTLPEVDAPEVEVVKDVHEIPSSEENVTQGYAAAYPTIEETTFTEPEPITTQPAAAIMPDEVTAPAIPVADEAVVPEPKIQTPVAESTTPTYQPSSPQAPALRSFTPPSQLLIVVVAVVAIILGVGTTMYFFGAEDARIEQVTAHVPNLVKAGEQITVPLAASRPALLQNIDQAGGTSAASITQIHPVVEINISQRPATVNEILSILALRAPGSFQRSITDITFGRFTTSEPFIVMKVKTFETALGGMLQWEQTMSADLTPLFGQTVLATFDPNVRTVGKTSTPYFVDVTASNHDMRVLQDEFGTDRITYSFLNSNTILITTSRDALPEISPSIR